MLTLPEYTYFDAAPARRSVAASDINFTGTWNGTTFYNPNFDVVNWGITGDQFIAIAANLNSPPTCGAWSALVQLNGTLPPALPKQSVVYSYGSIFG